MQEAMEGVKMGKTAQNKEKMVINVVFREKTLLFRGFYSKGPKILGFNAF